MVKHYNVMVKPGKQAGFRARGSNPGCHLLDKLKEHDEDQVAGSPGDKS